MPDLTDEELLDALGVAIEPEKKPAQTHRAERIVAGFEEIQRFVEKHGRAPRHGEGRDIFERLYAVRLDRLRASEECRALLAPLDQGRLLVAAAGVEAPPQAPYESKDDELLAQLGRPAAGDLTELRHVRSAADKRAAEEIANRQKCEDFEKFAPLFRAVQDDLASGMRQTRRFELKAEIRPGNFFIVGGQKAYVAEIGEIFSNAQGRRDARLRVIFDNGTESNLLMRSLQRALHKDEAGRRITDPVAGPLFAGKSETGDQESGTIYVLRSNSADPIIAKNRDLIHKIGVTGGDVERRIGNAKLDPTYLMADVEIVATYALFNINRTKLENLLHRVFEPARMNVEIKDRFGLPIVPREWFLLPITAVNEAVERLKDGTLPNYLYDPSSGKLRLRETVKGG